MVLSKICPQFFLFTLVICVLIHSLGCENGSKETKAPLSREQQLIVDAKSFPDSILLQENVMQYYRETSRYDEAIKWVNESLQKDSSNPRLWDIKATLLFENGDTLASIQAFENAVSLFPDPIYIMSLGTLYAQTKNEKALYVADALLMADKAKAEKEALFIKGLYYNYIGDQKTAIPFFDQCLALSYTFMDAYREKAIALYNLGSYSEALAVLDKAVTLQNNFDEGHYYRGRCLEKLNRKTEAAEAYKTALMYDPGYLEAQDALARLGF